MGKWLNSVGKKKTISLEGERAKRAKRCISESKHTDSAGVAGNFARLVRDFGLSHGLVLDDAVILAELDADDLNVLQYAETREKQVWAELLAYRLCKVRERYEC